MNLFTKQIIMVFGNWTAEIAHILHGNRRWSINIDELLHTRMVSTGEVYDMVHQILSKELSTEDSVNFLRALLFVVGRDNMVAFSNETLDNTIRNIETERQSDI